MVDGIPVLSPTCLIPFKAKSWLDLKERKLRQYVAEYNDGMKVSNLYIAQVKRKCGIELAENFNIPRSEGAKQPQCPKEKEEAIIGALKAFQMI